MVLKINDIDETQAPLLDHLIELRTRLAFVNIGDLEHHFSPQHPIRSS